MKSVMARSPLHTNRKRIRVAANRLFGRNLNIDERAYQSLEQVDRGATHVDQVWSSIVHTLPSIHLLFEALGLDSFPELTTINKAPLLPIEKNPNHYWEDRLRRVFCVLDRDHKTYSFTDAGEIVRKTSIINIDSLVAGVLESGELRTFRLKALKNMGFDIVGLPSKGFPPHSPRLKLRITNPMLEKVARYSGVSENGLWDDRVALLSATAIGIFNSVRKYDESVGDQQFILYHDGKRIRVAPFGVFGSYQLSESSLPDGSLWIARTNVLQPATRFSTEAIDLLEGLINSDAREVEFQSFFERHPEFLLVLGDYTRLHSQLVLHEEDGARLIPDFFLEKINSDFCDICDLKRPSAELIRHQKHRRRFRDAVMEAVSQLNFYRDWFDDRAHRKLFFDTYGLNAYRPRVVVIIGRQRSYFDEVERITLESNLPKWVELRTYDDVVSRARQWRNLAF